MRSLNGVMASRDMAVIGASRDPLKPGTLLLKTLQDTGYQGKVAGVNPAGGEANGIRLHASLFDVPFDIDLAVLIIPPRFVPEALADCARKGAKGVVITSEGFGESGEEGRRHQNPVSEVLKQTGMRAFGPNTLGIVNTETVFIGFAMLGENMFRPMAEVISENQSKPVFVSLLGSREDVAATEDFLRRERVPVVPFPETAIQVFARMWRYVQMNRLR